MWWAAPGVAVRGLAHGQTVLLSLDQTDLSNRFAVLMLALRVGDRSLPLAWQVEAGAANIGFGGNRRCWSGSGDGCRRALP